MQITKVEKLSPISEKSRSVAAVKVSTASKTTILCMNILQVQPVLPRLFRDTNTQGQPSVRDTTPYNGVLRFRKQTKT
jgi:hypothetical protein